jgi:predicted CDP-diglyceride synthetase/phosphatidate cytidylyltransferase
LSIGGKDVFAQFKSVWLLKTAVGLWILSLLASFFVLFPKWYEYNKDSVQSIKAMHKRIVKWKSILLILSLVLFLSALCMLAFVVFAG